MNCEKYLILIDDLIEGEPGAQNAEQVNLHISTCQECDSYYAMLTQEKEIYAQYLFDVEPPADLWTKLQTKIETDDSSHIVKTAVAASGWKSGIFNFFRLSPALGIAAVALVVFGIGLYKFPPDKSVSDDKYVAETNLRTNQTIVQQFDKSDRSEIKDLLTKAEIEKPKDFSKVVKATYKPKVLKRQTENARLVKAAKSKNDKQKLPDNPQLSEEQLQLKAIETETAQQIEKIELLLRSFRNARVVEGGTLYDVAYEKQQARKLLGKNVQLRQIAEIYGTLYTEELLDKAEPFLLDIANLENTPSSEQVLKIKERVRNQNIIASLQSY